MIVKHHLRELRDLCGYGVAGVGEESAALTGLVFDARDWCLRSFVIGRDGATCEAVEVSPTCFKSIDDERRELRFAMEADPAASVERFRPDTLSGSRRFDACTLIGRTVHGRDGPAGRLGDLLINVELWVLRYLVIDTDERRVLTDIEWASSLAEGRDRLRVDLPAEAIATAPRYGSLSGLSRGDEEALYRHYTHTSYVSRDGAR